MADSSSNPSAPGPEAGPPAIPDHELLRRIGRGSYGEVWLARNHTGTLRAVKIIRRDAFDNDRPYEREFAGLQHFEPLSREHPGLVDILQLGRNDGWFYSVMELADDAAEPAGNPRPESPSPNQSASADGAGNRPSAMGNWQSYQPLTLENRIRAEGRLPVKECVRIAATLAAGLRFLHERGLVHRDIKPSNIIFVGGVPKLADVGLVAQADSARTFVGTEGFVPPEGPGTVKADIYSLGKCLYEMAMGKDRQAFPSPPTLLDELPDRAELLELNEVITRACDPNPARRYQSAAELAADFCLMDAGGSVQKSRAWRRRFRLAWLTAVGLGMLVAVWLVAMRLNRPPADPRAQASWTHTLTPREFPLSAGATTSIELGSFDPNQEKAIFTSTLDGIFTVIALDGYRLISRQVSDFGSGNMHIQLLADTDRNGTDEIFTSCPHHGTNLLVGVLNQNLIEVRRFSAPGFITYVTNKEGMRNERYSAFEPAGFLPENRGEPPRLLLNWTHETKEFQRHLDCVNFTNRSNLWSFPMTGEARSLLVHDLDGDGQPDLLFSTSSPSNGLALADGRNDWTSDIIALRQDGSRLWWWTNFSPQFCTPELKIERWQSADCLFALASRDFHTARPLQAKLRSPQLPAFCRLARFDLRGNLLANWEETNHLYGFTLASLTPGGPTNLFASDASGRLDVFEPNGLKLLRRVPVTQRTNDWVQLKLIGIEDLDGDGCKEIALYSQQFEFLNGTNLGRPEEDRNIERTHDNRVIVLDHKFEQVASFQVTPRCNDAGTPFLAIVDNRLRSCKEIAVLGDKALFLRLIRR